MTKTDIVYDVWPWLQGFQASVTFNGETYNGDAAASHKAAQDSAAQRAYENFEPESSLVIGVQQVPDWLPSRFVTHGSAEPEYRGCVSFVDKDMKYGKIAACVGTVQVYADAIVGESGRVWKLHPSYDDAIVTGKLIVGRKATFRLDFDAKLRPKAYAVFLGGMLSQSVQLLWAQHARCVDVRSRDKEKEAATQKLAEECSQYLQRAKRDYVGEQKRAADKAKRRKA